MNEIENYLQTEVLHVRERILDFPSPFYNGVKVGYKKAKKLNDKHISFCNFLLNIIHISEENQHE